MEVSFHPYFHYVNIKVKQNSLASLNKPSHNETESSCRRYISGHSMPALHVLHKWGVQGMLYNVMARIEVHFVLTTKNKWLTNLVEEEKKSHKSYLYKPP